ncbi:hypothetical protein KXD93_03000 [Mucilaginibacter sp. BJC16-A38]|uniref:hypothetical protein n=1 Tax=Mucilaginibacter phenanthrenivorans TaxID=1234842 RepID=UPI002157416B|nr:hypothetical protein [Mucilaginibacter phenanthrenivorans]MCR8556589.1 hypothetical protein [Mucilaginibacter phenanthrenivorans]
MEVFQHIKTILSIILSLSIAHLLKGTVKLIQHPGREKPYWVHLLWALFVFLTLIHFWWWEYQLKNNTNWVFAEYFFVIIYITIFFVLCALLFPDDLKDYNSYQDYFYKKKSWFFGVLAVSFVADVIDTLIKGQEYFLLARWEYPVRIISHIALCLVAIKTNNKKFHAFLVIFFLIYELLFIWQLYSTEQ